MARRSKIDAAQARRTIASVRKAVEGAGLFLRCEARGEAYEVVKGPRSRRRLGMWRVTCGIVYLRPKAPARLIEALASCAAVRVCQ